MTSLNPVFSVGDQIGESLRLHAGLDAAAARARAIEMLQQVGIPAPERRVDEYPHQLSGGMRQRVMIAMALACRPDILIADEPTTALDVTVQAQIFDLLRDLQRDKGTAILLITHDMGAVAEMADRVMVMYAGRVDRAGHGGAGARRARPSVHAGPDRLPARARQQPRADDRGDARRARPRSPASCRRSGSWRAAAPSASAARMRCRAARRGAADVRGGEARAASRGLLAARATRPPAGCTPSAGWSATVNADRRSAARCCRSSDLKVHFPRAEAPAGSSRPRWCARSTASRSRSRAARRSRSSANRARARRRPRSR